MKERKTGEAAREVAVGINCTLRAAPVADLRRWIADPAYDLSAPGQRTLQLRKDWDGLHVLLTAGRGRKALRFLAEGGRAVPGQDAGLGPPRVLWPAAVRDLHGGLVGLTDAELARRFFPADRALRRKASAPDPDDLVILLGLVRQMREFVGRAAAAGNGLVVSYN